MVALLRQRNFALLWSSGFIDGVGDWILIGALPYYVYTLTGSALASGVMFTTLMVPGVLFGSVAGVLVDQWSRKRVMIVTRALDAVLVLLLLGLRSRDLLWLVYLVTFLQAFFGLFFDPAKNALIPLVVGEDRLVVANALNALSRNSSRLVGPALGGVFLAVSGLAAVVYADALSFVLAGSLIAAVAVPSPTTGVERPGSALRIWTATWRRWRDGLRLAMKSRPIATVFTVDGLEGLGDGIFQVIFVVFVRQILAGSAEQFGWLLSAQAVGGIIGGVLVTRFAAHVAPRLLLPLIFFNGVELLILARFPSLWVALLLSVFGGIPRAGYETGAVAVLQQGVTDAFRGRIFGAQFSLRTALVVTGQIVGGVLAARLGSLNLIAADGALLIVGGLIALLALRPRSRSQTRL